MELYSVFCGSLDTPIWMVESLPCSPETATLLIYYTSIQNKKFKRNKEILLPQNHDEIPPHTRNNKCWSGCGEIVNLAHTWRECQMVQLLWKTLQCFLQI